MAVIDPYRTLGISPGASLDEIKAAYRRLAKRYHPDSAGPGAAPRFVQITDAYDMLTSGRPPYAVTPRARTTRPAPTPRPAARPRPRAQPQQPPRQEWPGNERPPGARPTGRSRSGRRKATMGSTSYDGAAQGPLDPGWEGASWYGTDSGTYWTLNPREYADPRKHGPEYQERARRAAEGLPLDGDPPAKPAPATWAPPPRWEYGPGPDPRSVAAAQSEGLSYPGLLAAAVAIGGLVLGILTLFVLLGRP